MTEETADRYALIAAGTVIIVLTGAGFWLSYAHLAEVAGRHGLDRSPIRQWAWPATLDMFIVAGELLMLRAGLRRVTDWWAIGLTAAGSAGSIALNVAGVSGTTGSPVPVLDYVVAAVPPTGAMLAFGVLMRQIHQRIARPLRNGATETRTGAATGPDQPSPKPGPDPSRTTAPPDTTEPRTGPNPDHDETRTDTPAGPDRPSPKPGPRRTRTGPVRPRTVRAKVHAGRSERRTGPRRLSEEEVVELVLPDVPAVLAADGNEQITRTQLRSIMRARGIPLGNEHIGPVLTALRSATDSPKSHEGATHR
ncbi:DUF2637 domain-containing protein [Streptomyces sp. NBC_00249]|uniref:DUF2637 domain-containing protein n=1 Tax=Streptomyces sp. NBC_00249 TaxID=2975690 RepID=UPI00225487F1|nr:DUF2637 domain-containing protein [Streptomyces sp. NBC_00249]MCX5193180.1 DUF2637 domain-containing protein [Streptomyces sp. NBC_00249]